MLAVFIILIVRPVFGTLTAGNINGGEVCDFNVWYRHYWLGGPENGTPSFVANLRVNATGYYESGAAYVDDWECSRPEYQWDESGVAEFKLTFNDVTYIMSQGGFYPWSNDPWVRHYPIGLPSNVTQMKSFLPTYYSGVAFETADMVLWECGDWPEFVCECDGEYSAYCISRIERLDCYQNQIAFVPDTFITYRPDNIVSATGISVHWYVLVVDEIPNVTPILSPVSVCDGSGVVFVDRHGRDQDYSQQLCPPGTPCWYFRQTLGWSGSELDFTFIMGPGLGQAQRLQFQMWYHTLPVNRGNVCIFFDYSGIQWQLRDETDETSYNQIWCGELEPYNAGTMVLTVNFPLTYSPSYDSIFDDDEYGSGGEDYGQGYSTYRPLIIKGDETTAFVVYNVTINAMGPSYNEECYGGWDGGKKRKKSDLPPGPIPTYFTDAESANVYWSQWNPPANDGQRLQQPLPDFMKNMKI